MLATIAAAIQLNPKVGDIQNNISNASHMAFEAAAKGAKLIVLPELSMSGYSIHTLHEAYAHSQTKDGYQSKDLKEIAKKFNCYITFGYIELSEGNLYNSAAVIDGCGRIVANFRKNTLRGYENIWASKPNSIDVYPVVYTPTLGRIGVLLCNEASNTFESNKQIYKKGSLDTLALVTGWEEKYFYPDTRWIKLAEDLSCNVVVSNRVGTDGDVKFKGGSCIIDRKMNIWTNGSSFTESAVVGGILLI